MALHVCRPIFLFVLALANLLLINLSVLSASSFAAEFSETTESDLPVRFVGTLHATNALGDLKVVGWALDRVRVRAQKITTAADAVEAKKNFAAVAHRFRSVEDGIEVSSQYGATLDVADRVSRSGNHSTKLNLTIFAPSKMALKGWATLGLAEIKNWNGSVTFRHKKGSLRVEEVHKGDLSLVCPDCDITLHQIGASVRVVGGAGPIHADQVSTNRVYLESISGPIQLSSIQGEQVYLNKNGDIAGEDLSGDIEFHTSGGKVQLAEVMGSVEGATESGDIKLGIKKWKCRERASIESGAGTIALHVPRSFASEVEFSSKKGRVETDLGLETREGEPDNPSTSSHREGIVNSGTSYLKVSSDAGDVVVSQSKSQF